MSGKFCSHMLKKQYFHYFCWYLRFLLGRLDAFWSQYQACFHLLMVEPVFWVSKEKTLYGYLILFCWERLIMHLQIGFNFLNFFLVLRRYHLRSSLLFYVHQVSAHAADVVELFIYLGEPCHVCQLLLTVAHGADDTNFPSTVDVRTGRYLDGLKLVLEVWYISVLIFLNFVWPSVFTSMFFLSSLLTGLPFSFLVKNRIIVFSSWLYLKSYSSCKFV